MDEERQKMRGPLLGLVIVVALMGASLFCSAIYRAYHLNFGTATVAFLMATVAWLLSFKLYEAWRYLGNP